MWLETYRTKFLAAFRRLCARGRISNIQMRFLSKDLSRGTLKAAAHEFLLATIAMKFEKKNPHTVDMAEVLLILDLFYCCWQDTTIHVCPLLEG
mmetsp:Transcript_33773/g.79617  ORF Transcript_33773/g.79617 Transcript_33773/m.79617 type:complete len:94 (+) Transcript_33773:1000-1281(+)